MYIKPCILKKFLLFAVFFSNLMFCFAQSNRRAHGLVSDSTGTALGDITIWLVTGSDSLSSLSNKEGSFHFSKIKADTFSIKISALGYRPFAQSYAFGKSKNMDLAPIRLYPTAYLLDAVEIKAKPQPVRFMQDTIEYNAAAYRVDEGDNVVDLLRQLSGIEVDEENNVSSMGKGLVKLRVNGQDFFTSDVKEFIAKLPAAIVSKIQVIDDYGDEANFTGIKTGEPSKMLNIVTKPGMNKGVFGGASLTGGTKGLFSGSGNVNQWKESRQRGANLNITTQNNGAGTSSARNISINHRDKLGKYGSFNFVYRYSGNRTAFERGEDVSTLIEGGNFYSSNTSNGENKGNNQGLNAAYTFNDKKTMLNSTLDLSYRKNGNSHASFNKQSGVLRQDIGNQSELEANSPAFQFQLNVSRKLRKPGNSFSANMGLSANNTDNQQYIRTETRYYEQDSELLKKDSVLSRNIRSRTQNQQLTLGLAYQIGLRPSKKDSLLKRSISLNYRASIGHTQSDIITDVLNNKDQEAHFVDSLSSKTASLLINQSLGMSLNRQNAKWRYSLGFTAQPMLMRNQYQHLHRELSSTRIRYSPTLNLSSNLGKGKTISFIYTGANNPPSITQLQPLRNTQNLQNIVVGNPDLKPFFTHQVSANYNYNHQKSGNIFVMAGLSALTTQNEIVNNLILLRDTLNSFRQETHYLNTNGTYNANINYNVNVGLIKDRLSLTQGGSIGLSNKAIFINSLRRFNKGINFSQRLSANLNFKKLTLSSGVNYTYNSNTNVLNSGFIGELYQQSLLSSTFFRSQTLGFNVNTNLRFKRFMGNVHINYNGTHNSGEAGPIKNIRRLLVSASGTLLIPKGFELDFMASQQFNKGDASTANPFILNLNFKKELLKEEGLNVFVSANDLFNQGNSLTRMVSGNSVIDSRSNLVTRFFSLGLMYSLSNFGGKQIMVRQASPMMVK